MVTINYLGEENRVASHRVASHREMPAMKPSRGGALAPPPSPPVGAFIIPLASH